MRIAFLIIAKDCDTCIRSESRRPVVKWHLYILPDDLLSLVATSADSVPSSYLVRFTIAPIGTTFGNLQWRRYQNNFTFEYSSNNNIFSFVAMSADFVPSSKINIFQYKLIYCRHFRTYSRWAIFDWSDTVFRRRNVTRRRIPNTVLQPRHWGREADSPEVCRLDLLCGPKLITQY